MGVKIDCKTREILDVKNIVFEFIYINMLHYIEEKKIILSIDLQNLIDELDQGGYGIGCDIADFVNSKKDAKIFAEIVKRAINKYQAEFSSISEERKKRLENFHQELLAHAEELRE